ncbi:hypothetical protein [Mycolicibacterium sp.]|uniref:hypothetical protein n=1 Tax=Mycolicibacterium sp. TaxID=2320850 RepID=UPI00355EA551
MSTPLVPRERRRHVVRLVKRVGLHQAPLSEAARLTYVIGALIADDAGCIKKADLTEAAKNPKIVALAANILTVTALDAGAL